MKKGSTKKRKEIPWDDLNFKKQKVDSQVVAECTKCLLILKNTSHDRLLAHRNICNPSEEIPAKRRNEGLESSINKEDASIIDEALGRFFFGCNIPFSVVESDNFKKFVYALNKNYKPPSRGTLGGSILNKVYSNIIQENATLVDKQSVLLVDGWKNKSKNEKYVVSMMHNASGERIFLNSEDYTEKSETALALKETVSEAIIEAKQKYGTDIYAVVSDNVSSMVSMGKKIDSWHTTCNSHSGNLLANSLVHSSTITKQIMPVLKEFKSSPFLERQLVKKNGTKIRLPGDTRWCSYRDSLRCFVRNLSQMREVLKEEPTKVSNDVAAIIIDQNIEDNVVQFTIVLDSVCELVNRCQSDNSNIADALEEWLKLRFPICNETYEKLLEDRLKKVVKPIGLASNLLHPSYRGKIFDINPEYNEKAKTFLNENLNLNGQQDLISFFKNEGVFKILMDKKIEDPIIFWSSAETNHPDLSALALKLFKIPSSTAALERLFSQWKYVHNKIRNRLSAETSTKLIHVYYTLRIRDSNNDSDDY